MRNRKFHKKTKKLKKLKNTITDSFQAKIGWTMLTKRENKNYRSVSFLLDANRKFQKNNEKIKKYQYEFISSQNRLEKDAKERK